MRGMQIDLDLLDLSLEIDLDSKVEKSYSCILGLPPDADGNGNYAFFDAANYALIQLTGGVTAIPAV